MWVTRVVWSDLSHKQAEKFLEAVLHSLHSSDNLKARKGQVTLQRAGSSLGLGCLYHTHL